MRRRVIRVVAVSLAAALVAAGGAAWWAIGRADRFVEQAKARPEQAGRELLVELSRPVGLGRGGHAVLVVTAVDDTRDGAALGGRTFVATSGGLFAWAPGMAAGARPWTQLDGLAGVDLTAAGPLGDKLVFGDADGGLTLVDGERATAARIALPRAGAIADIAPAGATAYLLVTGVGVLSFDGRRAIDVGAAAGVDLAAASAICDGGGGLAVGTRDGALYRERGAALVRVEASLGAPVTALACDGETLYAGTPFGLSRVDGARVTPLLADAFVTSVLPQPGALLVATFDDGVRVVDPASGRVRATLRAGRRVHRLRASDGRVLAFGPGGPWVWSAGDLAPLGPAPAAGLSGPHVTALARDGASRLWVGTFEHGVDVLDGNLAPKLHFPRQAAGEDARDDQVNALLYGTGGMHAATVHGVDAWEGAFAERRVPIEGVDDAAAIAFYQGHLAVGHSKGVTLVDGAKVRTLYAFHGLANNHVYALAALGDRLAVGTLGGLSLVRDGKVERTIGAGPRGLRAAWVTALERSPDGLYVGTYGGGVQLLRPDDTVEDVSAGRGFHVNPGALAAARGTLWVGTLESGLLAFDAPSHAWRRLDPRLLPSQNVTALLIDGDAILVGTTAGLVRIPRSVLDESLVPEKRS